MNDSLMSAIHDTHEIAVRAADAIAAVRAYKARRDEVLARGNVHQDVAAAIELRLAVALIEISLP